MSKFTLPSEGTRTEAFTWKQKCLASQGYHTFETEICRDPAISRSHVNNHAFDQDDI